MVDAELLSVKSAVVTAAQFDYERLRYAGAVYDAAGLVERSIRPALAWNFEQREEPSVHEPMHLASGLYLGRLFSHFGHFLIETLPNFAFADKTSPLILHPWPETLTRANLNIPHIKLSLEALGIDPERIVFADRLLHVDDLRVAPRNAAMANQPSPHTIPVFRKIADHVGGGSHIGAPKYLYFSRRHFKGKRGTHEEDAIEALFQRLGFTIIFPETLPFAEQVALADGAQYVAAVDGSALHLCGFMRPSGRCLVLSTRPRHKMIEAINALAGVATDWIDEAGAFDTALGAVRLHRETIESGVKKWVEEFTPLRWEPLE